MLVLPEDVWLVKTDMNGYEMWNRTYGSAGKTHGYYVVQTVDGGYALVGSDTSSSDNSDVWLVKTDADGNELWNHTYGGPETDLARIVVATSDGGYAIIGITQSFGAGKMDFWLIKTNEYGIVPEAKWVILPLMATATLAILITKKKPHTHPKAT